MFFPFVGPVQRISLPKASVRQPEKFSKRATRFPTLAFILILTWTVSPLRAYSPTGSASQESQPSVSGGPQPTSENFEALIDHSTGTWPTVPVEAMRLWCTNTRWAQINPSQGTYDWTRVDKWLAAGQEHGVNFLFTLAMTPSWASSNPNNRTCQFGPGQCEPPNDLNPDGSGSDQHWKDFVGAIVTHVSGQILFWEIWNEPLETWYWNGTYAQMARMAQDARTIILSINPNAKLLTAGAEAHYPHSLKWWNGYAAAGGLEYADIIAVHGDVRTFPQKCKLYPEAETFIAVMQNLKAVLHQYGQQNKPVWDTEASWGETNDDCFTDRDLQAAFLARFYLIHRSERIRRFYWRGWIDPHGGLYNPVTKQMNKAGVAFGQIHSWLTGNSMVKTCMANGTVWTCNFIGRNGYAAQAVWDTSKTCEHGTCYTRQYTVDSQFVDYLTLDGAKFPIANNTVPIGAKPIWLEN